MTVRDPWTFDPNPYKPPSWRDEPEPKVDSEGFLLLIATARPFTAMAYRARPNNGAACLILLFWMAIMEPFFWVTCIVYAYLYLSGNLL
jgi:hypothetical protein